MILSKKQGMVGYITSSISDPWGGIEPGDITMTITGLGPSTDSVTIEHHTAPLNSRASLYVDSGRYPKKNCFHWKHSDVEVTGVPWITPDYTRGSASGTFSRTRPDGRVATHQWRIIYDRWGRPWQCYNRSYYNAPSWSNDMEAFIIIDGTVRHVARPNTHVVDWADFMAKVPLNPSSSGINRWTVVVEPQEPGSESFSDLWDAAHERLMAISAAIDQEFPASELTDKALSNYTGPNVSWLETLIPLKDTGDLLRTLGTAPRTLKELAGWFLAYKYGAAPFPGSVKDIAETISNVINHTIRKDMLITLNASMPFRGNSYSGTARCTIRARIANAAVLRAAQMGVADPFTEIWNCIPYSFVVDWFLGVGDTIAQVETEALWKSLELLEICTSYKVSGDFSQLCADYAPSTGLICQGEFSLYKRHYWSSLPARNYFQLPDVPENFRRHWAEGLALVAQQVL